MKKELSPINRLWVAIVLNLIIPIVEVIGGIFTGSLALISDAVHNFTDLLSLFLSLFGEKATKWRANEVQTYGYGRVEILISAINSSVLIIIAGFLIWKGITTISLVRQLPGWPIMILAGMAFVANLLSALVLSPDAKKSLNIRSAFLHLALDAGQSLIVVLSGLLIAVFGWSFLDSVLTIIFGALIIYSSTGVLREAINVLIEGVPLDLQSADVRAFIKSFSGVEDVHHLHIWSLSSRDKALSAHLVLKDQLLSQSTELVSKLSQALKDKFDVDHPTFQVECGSCPTSDSHTNNQ